MSAFVPMLPCQDKMFFIQSVVRTTEINILFIFDSLLHQLLISVVCFFQLSSPKSIIENPVNAVTTRYVRTATNKIRCPIFSLSVSYLAFS